MYISIIGRIQAKIQLYLKCVHTQKALGKNWLKSPQIPSHRIK